MPIPSTTRFLRSASAALLLAALGSAGAANAQSGATGGTVAGTGHAHKSGRRGTANQPAPSEHQVQPSQRLQDEPNQVKEQVAPIPDAPVKPGSVPAPGQDTPKPQG